MKHKYTTTPREDIGYLGHDHSDIGKGLFVIRKTKQRELIDRIPFPTLAQHLEALRQ